MIFIAITRAKPWEKVSTNTTFRIIGALILTPAMMDLKLRIVENKDDECAGCMVYANKEIITFQVDYMRDLLKAMETE